MNMPPANLSGGGGGGGAGGGVDMAGKVKVRCGPCGALLAVDENAEKFECGRCKNVGITRERRI